MTLKEKPMTKYQYIKETAEGMFVEMTDVPKPIEKDYEVLDYSTYEYNSAMKDWNKTVTRHPVRYQEKMEFKYLAYKLSGCKTTYSFEKALAEGIEVSGRVELEKESCNFHKLKFIGDGIWECKKCKQTKTNNIPTTDPHYITCPIIKQTF